MRLTLIAVAIIVAVVASIAVSTALSSVENSRPSIHVLLCAAARKAWERVIEMFEEETGIHVVPVYGSSGQLFSMLAAGVDVDVYAPASPHYMVKAVEFGLVDPSTIRAVAFLVPVIAVPKGNPGHIHDIYDLAKPGVKVALGDLESTAIGFHSRWILERAGILGKVLDNTVVFADTFTRLSAIVATGAVDAAIAWNVIAYWYPDRVEIIPLPQELVNATWIPIAIASGSQNRVYALEFIEFVTSNPRARRVFEELGYIIDEASLAELVSGVEASWLLESFGS